MTVTVKAGPFGTPVYMGDNVTGIEFRDTETGELLRFIQFPSGGKTDCMITSTKGEPNFQAEAFECGIPIHLPPGYIPGSIVLSH